MAKANNAALAINCDWSGFRMNGIVIRNGKTYIDKGKRPGFVVNRDGSAGLYDETKTDASKLLAAGAWQTISFGPWLVQDGKAVDGIETYEIGDFGPVQPGSSGSMQGLHPRAGIGFVDKGHFLLVGVDGYPQNGTESRGLTIPDFAKLFVGLGVKYAYNFDGGGSWTMYLNGSVINKPGDPGGQERLVGDILYIGK
jgi:exopolysaccharide biosynthesis protein